MADQNNKPKTISFAGRNIDQNEFTRRARQKAAEWAQYQGLKGDEINDFNESLNDILAGISDGRYTVTESGALSGKGASTPNTYKTSTGARVDDSHGGNSRRRRGFDPNANVMGYLNGIAGAMSKSGSTSNSSSSKAKSTSMQQYISDAIFGEGNSFSPEQLVRWADAYDAVGADGKRGISGRRQWVADTLNEYRKKYNNGDFGEVSDEDRTKTNELIDSIISNNNPDIDKDWKLSKDAPWLSHLLFRDAKYYSDDAARQADAAKSEDAEYQAKLQAYVNGVEGATNPYTPGTQEYLAAEEARKGQDAATSALEFRNQHWDYADGGQTFRTEVTDALGNDLFSSWNAAKVREYLTGADGLNTDEQGRDVYRAAGMSEMFHNNYTGWGEGDTSLEDSGLMDYFKALPNDYRPDDTSGSIGWWSGNRRARSNKAILGKAALDYARNIIGNSGSTYMLNDGSYLLPQLIDWNTGKAYKIVLHGNKATATTANIGDVINGMNPESPLYNTLLNEWRHFTNRRTYKEGGIIKAQNGRRLSQGEIDILTNAARSSYTAPQQESYTPLYQGTTVAPTTSQAEADAQRFTTAQQNGVKKQNREDSKAESPDFTGVEIARIGAAAADLASIAAAWAPGYGTAAAGALGIGSSLATLGADIADPSVSGWDVAKGLGINLGLDLASLAPGIGASAGVAKVTKNIVKLAPKLLMAFSLYQVGPDAINSLGKLTRGEKMTRDDIRNLSYGLSALAGIHNTAVAGGKRAVLRKQGMPDLKPGEVEFSYKNKDGKVVTAEVENPKALVEKINEAGKKGKTEAEKVLREAVGDDAATFTDNVRFSDNKVLNFFRKKASVEQGPGKINNEQYLEWLSKIRKQEQDKIAAKTASSNKVVSKFYNFAKNHLNTDTDIMFGGSTWYRSPLRGKGRMDYRSNADALQTNMEKTILDDLVPGTKTDKIKNDVTSRTSESTEALKTAEANYNKIYGKYAEELKTTREANKSAVEAEGNAKGSVEKSLSKIKGLKGKFDTKVKTVEGKVADINEFNDITAKISSLESTIAKLEGAKKLSPERQAKLEQARKDLKVQQDLINGRTQEKQAEQYLQAMEAITKHREAQTATADARSARENVVRRARKRSQYSITDKLRENVNSAREVAGKPAGTAESYIPIAETLGIKLEGTTPNIKARKEENFKNFIEFLKSNGQKDAQIQEILADKNLVDKARATFKFYRGGILKANVGAKAPELNEEDKTSKDTTSKPTSTVNWTGTLGKATPATTPASEETPVPEGLINPQQFGPKPGWIGYGINPTDRAITRLEDAKYGLTQGINAGIYNVYAGFRGFHETPLLKHYRQWSAKPLEDQMAKNLAEYRRMGARSAAGTTDQNQAFAWQLAATDKAMAANAPLAIQANEQIKTTVDQQNAVGNENFANMHGVGERNRQGDVALSNARLKAFADYLHKMGTTATQNMMSRQYGMAKAGIMNDQRAAQAAAANDPTVSQAKNRYQELLMKKSTDPDTWTDADESALKVATQNYKFANSNFINRWNATHIPTTGSPYAGYGTTFGEPEYFDFVNFNTGFSYAKGGKMEAAEREKTRREYEKIYHDSMKLMVQESNKKLRNSAYAFYRKLFMHAK